MAPKADESSIEINLANGHRLSVSGALSHKTA
jgi:hypothetical protein